MWIYYYSYTKGIQKLQPPCNLHNRKSWRLFLPSGWQTKHGHRALLMPCWANTGWAVAPYPVGGSLEYHQRCRFSLGLFVSCPSTCWICTCGLFAVGSETTTGWRKVKGNSEEVSLALMQWAVARLAKPRVAPVLSLHSQWCVHHQLEWEVSLIVVQRLNPSIMQLHHIGQTSAILTPTLDYTWVLDCFLMLSYVDFFQRKPLCSKNHLDDHI